MTSLDLQGRGMTSRRTRDRLIERLRAQGIVDNRVLSQIQSVPRHLFVDEALAHRAYEDTALPIGHGQTISQPFIVALMSQALFEQPRGRVLEIGTGCGYQSALLAALATEVFSVERVEALFRRARERLRQLQIRNVRLRYGDGYEGWPDEAPFDGILVTAAPIEVPQRLLEQLAPGGRLVVPEGAGSVQELKVYDRALDGELQVATIEYVRFVPLLKGLTVQ